MIVLHWLAPYSKLWVKTQGLLKWSSLMADTVFRCEITELGAWVWVIWHQWGKLKTSNDVAQQCAGRGRMFLQNGAFSSNMHAKSV